MPEDRVLYQERLSSLRAEMQAMGVDGFIIPHTDEYQGEFLAPYAERLAWLSGFTGSAGTAVVLSEKAMVMSDGRYTIQLRGQVDERLYALEDSTKTNVGAWIARHARGGMNIGYDAWLHTRSEIQAINGVLPENVSLVPVASNPIDLIWEDQPERPRGRINIFPHDIAGRDSVQKRTDICRIMREKGADAIFLTQSDSICWLLNIRGRDVAFSPLVQSYVILHADGTLWWIVEPAKVGAEVLQHVGGDIQLVKLENIQIVLARLKGKMIWADDKSVPLWFLQNCDGIIKGAINERDPCVRPKSLKTPQEQHSIKAAHIADALAFVKFMAWLEGEVPSGALDEMGVSEKLNEFRSGDHRYKGESFAAISGFGANGAIIHYRADSQSNAKIIGNGLLLLDSGGQYEWGTTDITRTFAIGTPEEEMRINYTRVLQGHIALASAHFPEGTTGAQLDALARRALWDAGLDYAHGTGHGVGCYLGVHEEAASISPRGHTPFEAGMLISNEPGYYKEGHYGIRLENLVLVREVGVCRDTGRKMLGFETVTLVPFEYDLIVTDMLGRAERAWLCDYHRIILKTLQPQLGVNYVRWLEQKCQAFIRLS